jgi:hypothetical protein
MTGKSTKRSRCLPFQLPLDRVQKLFYQRIECAGHGCPAKETALILKKPFRQ